MCPQVNNFSKIRLQNKIAQFAGLHFPNWQFFFLLTCAVVGAFSCSFLALTDEVDFSTVLFEINFSIFQR